MTYLEGACLSVTALCSSRVSNDSLAYPDAACLPITSNSLTYLQGACLPSTVHRCSIMSNDSLAYLGSVCHSVTVIAVA